MTDNTDEKEYRLPPLDLDKFMEIAEHMDIPELRDIWKTLYDGCTPEQREQLEARIDEMYQEIVDELNSQK